MDPSRPDHFPRTQGRPTRYFVACSLALLAVLGAPPGPGGSLAIGPVAAHAQPPFAEPPAADPTDPYVVAKAAELGNDVDAIFQFVRDEIRFLPYQGSFGGARGALWTKGANSLDRSSLLIALLKASGVPVARYVRGQVSGADLEQLILAMYDEPSRVIGCIPPGSVNYFPQFDGELQNDVGNHFWVEFDAGGGLTQADTSLPDLQLGDAIATPLETFDDIPDSLSHKVVLKVSAETFTQAAAAFALNGGLGTTTVLERTFRTSSLVGRPLSIGQFVSSSALGGLPFGSVTNSYTPWVLVGQGDDDIASDPIIVGTPFQEQITNFPLGNTLVTGLFLAIEVRGIGGPPQTFTRTLFDRVGFAIRQTGGRIEVPNAADAAPVLNDFDVTTVNVLAGLQSLEAFGAQRDRVGAVQQQLDAIEPDLVAIDPAGPFTAPEVALLREGAELSRYLAIANAETLTMGFVAAADRARLQLEPGYLLSAYYVSPRITLGVSRKDGDAAALELDVLKNDIRAKGFPGQNLQAPIWFEVTRGILESSLEGQVLAAATGQPSISILEILQAAQSAGDLALVTRQNLEDLDLTTLSPQAKARITAAVDAGRIVLTPTRMITLGATTTVGWLETDGTGHTISVFENGGHQAIVNYAGALEFSQEFNAPFAQFIGGVSAFGQVGFLFAAAVVDAAATGGGFDSTVKATKTSIAELIEQSEAMNKVFEDMKEQFEKYQQDTTGFSLIGSFVKGFMDGLKFARNFFKYLAPADPPVFPFLSSPPGDVAPPVAPGPNPGVDVTIVPDPFFTVSSNGAELPTVFSARIQNLGPDPERFNLTGPAFVDGFQVFPSVSAISVPPGETGEVGICLRPIGALSAPGTPANLGLTATGVNVGVQDTGQAGLSVPAFEGVVLRFDREEAATTAGTPFAVTLSIRATGNVGGSVDLSLILPPGVQATGLSTPVALTPGQLVTQQLVITPNASVPDGVDLLVVAQGELGAMVPRQQVSADFRFRIVEAPGQCAADAAAVARDIGRTGLADALLAIAEAASDLAADPTDGSARAELSVYLGNAIGQMNIPAFAQAAADLTAARDALATASPALIPGILNDVNLALCALQVVLDSANGHDAAFVLLPSSATIQPQSTTRFTPRLINFSPLTRTFDFTVEGVPAGFTATLNRSRVTLAPFSGTFGADEVFLDIAHVSGPLEPFTFRVTATDAAAPAAMRTVTGTLSVREEILSVVDVRATPGFTDPGTAVSVKARIYNAVNRSTVVRVDAALKNANGQFAVFPTVVANNVTLGLSASIVDVDFPFTPPANLAPGPYTIEVSLVSAGGLAIPGAVGTGPLFVGAPLAAALSLDPSILPTGDGVVETTLTLDRDSIMNPTASIIGAVDTPGIAKNVAFLGTLAYVCNNASVSIVDVSDPTAPVLLSSFYDGPGDLGADFNSVGCFLHDGDLVVGYAKGGSPPPPLTLAIFDLTDPLAPALISETGFNKIIGGGIQFAAGDAGFSTTGLVEFNIFSGFIFNQAGNFLAFDLSDPTAPTLTDQLFTDDPAKGGPNFVVSSTPIGGDVALVASTTATGDGFGTGPGDGKALFVDLSDPSNLATENTILVPETTLLLNGAVDAGAGTALVTGDTFGFDTAFSGFIGFVSLTTFDVSDPHAPSLGSTVVTSLKANQGTDVESLGNGIFAVVGATQGSQNVVLLVDATDPGDLRYIPYNAPSLTTSVVKEGDLLYASGPEGLTVFELGTVEGPDLTARVDVPRNTGVDIVPGSFSLAPTEIVNGAEFDTLVWRRPLPDVITWESTVQDLAPGDVRPVALGGRVEFVLPTLGQGVIALNPVSVSGEHILGLAPASVLIDVGQSANYTLTVKNPTASAVHYALSVEGVPDGWVDLADAVDVPAGGTANVPLVLTPDLATGGSGIFEFFVTAAGDNGASESVGGELRTNNGANLGGNPTARTFGFAVEATPAERDAGQGTPATFNLNVTNVGNADDFLDVFVDAPGGWIVATAPATSVFLLPGAANARDVELSLTPPVGTPPGPVDITVRARSFNSFQEFPTTVRVNVLGQGVEVGLTPSPGTPATTFQLAVRNRGNAVDTFDLSVGGPLAEIAMLGASELTLAPGELQQVSISLGAIPFALPGNVALVATATSRTSPSVSRSATAIVAVGDAMAVDAEVSPAEQTLPAPGAASFLVEAMNLGNVADSFSATIVGTTGPVTATLRDLDGQPMQAVPSFFLPSFASGQLPLDVVLTGPGVGSVTVRVESLASPSVSDEVTAIVQTEGEPTPTPTPSPTPTPVVTSSPEVPLDAFKCYLGRKARGSAAFTPVAGVELADEFETASVDLVRESDLCNPVAPAGDPETHLACYSFRTTDDAPSVAPPDLTIDNQFGTQTIHFPPKSKARTLCVPAAAHVEGAPDEAANPDHARFRCRKVKRVGRAPSPAPEIDVVDEFETKRMRVRALLSLCTPVGIDGAEVVDPETHLACYRLAQAPRQGKFVSPGRIEASSELADQTLMVSGGKRRICVPTRILP